MKAAFWTLAIVAAGALGLTVFETHRVRVAQAELDKSIQVNARVQTVLIQKQREGLAAARAESASSSSSQR